MFRAPALLCLLAALSAPSPGGGALVRASSSNALPSPDTVPSPPRPAYLGFGYGLILGHLQVREDLLLPLRWRGPQAGLDMRWEGGSGPGRHRLSLVVPVSVLHERFGNAGGAMGLEASYAYDRVVRRGPGGRDLSLGGALGMHQHNGIYFSWDEEHLYWLTAWSLAPRLAWRPPGPGGGWALAVDLPVVALISRPPGPPTGKRDPLTDPWFHLTGPQEGLTLSGLPHYAALHAGVELPRRWGGRRFVLSYGLELATYDAPARVTTVAHRFGFAHFPGS